MTTSNAFIRDLVDNMPTPNAKLAVVSVLAKWSGQTVYLPMDSKAKRRQRAAEHMLVNGMAPAAVADALRQRFGISLRTAQRDVSSARHMSEGNGSADGSNGGS